ncbi:hypothetical protein GOODEAATRI_028914 [Goodea atripinnis]|uniref:G-protein coupled receptors family 1 profile domain-containing protein n=1 Tax=Goodea atripinnis TaxID=208336 RepID=A0ABV0MW31_9TELE
MDHVYNNTPFTQNLTNTSINHNNTSKNDSCSSSPFEGTFCSRFEDKLQLYTRVIICIWTSLAPQAIFCLCSQMRSDQVVPVFIINLLLADSLQICCMIAKVAGLKHCLTHEIIDIFEYWGAIASVFFMTFIAMQRYFLIAWPFWYRFSRTLKVSASVSAVSWILSIYIGFNDGGWLAAIPLPLFIFFLVRTLKALSTSHNVPSDEKRQIVVVGTVVVFTYTLTFVPYIIRKLFSTTYINFIILSCAVTQISPLTDLLLYILIKKWVFDKLLAFLCSCRKTKDVHQQTNSITTTTCTSSSSQSQTETENNP